MTVAHSPAAIMRNHLENCFGQSEKAYARQRSVFCSCFWRVGIVGCQICILRVFTLDQPNSDPSRCLCMWSQSGILAQSTVLCDNRQRSREDFVDMGRRGKEMVVYQRLGLELVARAVKKIKKPCPPQTARIQALLHSFNDILFYLEIFGWVK